MLLFHGRRKEAMVQPREKIHSMANILRLGCDGRLGMIVPLFAQRLRVPHPLLVVAGKRAIFWGVLFEWFDRLLNDHWYPRLLLSVESRAIWPLLLNHIHSE